MPRPSNQTIERYYFDQFARDFPLPSGRVEYTDKPDIIIHGQIKTGIEIANLYLRDGSDSSSEQVQRRRRLAVLSMAQDIHRRGGGRSIELNVDFDPSNPITDIHEVAKAIANIAEKAEKQTGGQVSREIHREIRHVRFVYHSGQEYDDAKWRTVQMYSVPELNVGRLREVVEIKNRKSAEYQPCDVYWLLLVVDFMDSAQDQEIGDMAGLALIASPFQQILLYKPQFKQVIRVRNDA